ncbi:rhodanese-related sulfurtransferase/predicted transcriptional regulator [Streptomyces umbrinus]|uniref:Rhodanese-related sulfurtransferase/predicted transcriptional regulator n=1 Tax=Streptomyces umbrinus TaxID=67370 RepID=A0ABU0SMJ0_9ACTN|nr:metalloregulator ArsR/SmtB family transcription factor [Streptomyces umbrinus]MDQ1024765.1 rhodanese-related sulfurtransferase/predicted transcriptional regulator [Streptomyces umbrinus]
MGDSGLKAELYEQFARVGKAFGSGKRLELLDLIAQGERTVDSLAKAAELGLTTASAHLQALKRAGVVTTRREGTRVYYRLSGEDVAALYVLIRNVAQTHIADTERARAVYLGEATEAIGREELLARAKEGSVIVLDVRSHEEYVAGHIPGAFSVPLEELDDRLTALPSDREIVAYCRGSYCVLAHDAVRLLNSRGRKARRLVDGMLEWRVDGLPITSESV